MGKIMDVIIEEENLAAHEVADTMTIFGWPVSSFRKYQIPVASSDASFVRWDRGYVMSGREILL